MFEAKSTETALIRLEEKVDSKIYIEEVLKSHLLPFLQGLEEDYEFQQDNALIHKSKLTTKFFENLEINCLDRAQTSILLSTCGTNSNVVLENKNHHQKLRQIASNRLKNLYQNLILSRILEFKG